MELKIEKCLHCGGEGQISSEIINIGFGGSDTSYFVYCVNCKIRTKGYGSLDESKVEKRIKRAIKDWNRRIK